VIHAYLTPPPPPGIKAPPLSFATRVGDLLFISGIPGFDANGGLPDTFEAQFTNVVTNIKRVLDEAGSSFRDLVKVNVLLTRASDVATMNALYAGAFGPAPYPACTTCVVQALRGASLVPHALGASLALSSRSKTSYAYLTGQRRLVARINSIAPQQAPQPCIT
jgi:2-iminobutanoate/2-iminopropanoate deaminase